MVGRGTQGVRAEVSGGAVCAGEGPPSAKGELWEDEKGLQTLAEGLEAWLW